LFGLQRKSPSTDFYQYLTVAYRLPWQSVTGDEKIPRVAYPNRGVLLAQLFFLMH
jgi:hypothetical protein